MRWVWVTTASNYLHTLLHAAISLVIDIITRSGVPTSSEATELVNHNEVQSHNNTKREAPPVSLGHISLISSHSSTDSIGDDDFGALALPSSKERPLEPADLDVPDVLTETPDTTVDLTTDSMLQHSFELQHSGLDDATSNSATDLLLFASAIPHAAQGPRSRSAAIPRPSVPPARKAGSPVRRYRRELVLWHEPLSLALRQPHGADGRRVRRLLDAGQADHGYSALMLAVEAGSDDVLNLLVGREPRCQDRWSITALMHATLLGRLDAAERLAPYDAGRSDREGRTALIMASYCGHSRLLPRLVAEIGLGGFTSLMYSAALNDTAGMQQALALAGQQDALGRTPDICRAIRPPKHPGFSFGRK